MPREKKALLIGINYKNTESELNGCINDVNNMRNVLINLFGYKDSNILILTDDTAIKPTRNNILTQLLGLVLHNNTDLYVHYSGHGAQIKDTNNDEQDGYDESLVPIDYTESGFITDDELRCIIGCMNETCKLTIVLDCCHSGSGMDLAYNLYERNGLNYLLEDPLTKCNKTRGQVTCISGCKDSQTSADAYIGIQYQGALTNTLITILNTLTLRNRTYNNVYNELKKGLIINNYTQIPCFSSGTMININSILSL